MEQKIRIYYDEYICAAKLQGEATKIGNSKTANRQYTFLKKIFIDVQKDIDTARLFYKELRNNSEANVKLCACAHSLALGLDIVEAEKILENLSEDSNIGILRLNAEMTLKMWKKQGYLKF